MLNCCVCGKGLLTENPKKFYCPDCYKKWYGAIQNKEPWIKACVNDEKKRRRQALKYSQLIYLGDEFDIGGFDGECRLVSTKGYYEEWD